jgi:hypothetical protein
MLSTLLISILFLITILILLLAGKWVIAQATSQAKTVGEISKALISEQSQAYKSSLASLAAAQAESLEHLFPRPPPDSTEQPSSGRADGDSLTFEEELALLPPSMRDQIQRERLEEEAIHPLEGAPTRMDPRAVVIDPSKLPSEGSVIYRPPNERS